MGVETGRLLAETGCQYLTSLCGALGLDASAANATALVEQLMSPWGRQPISKSPVWQSHVTDDGTPFEFSVSFDDEPELRVMVEPLGAHGTLQSNQDAAMRLLSMLEARRALNLQRFERVRDLFLPPTPGGSFAVWIATMLHRSRPPEFKLYLDPTVNGVGNAPALVEETLMRLGFRSSWPFVARSLLRRGLALDELKYLSLDLSASPEARVKVYCRHRLARATDLEQAAQVAGLYRAGDVTRFLEALLPEASEYRGRAPFTCYSFTDPQSGPPSSSTTHFPINGYAADDLDARERICRALRRFGLPTTPYVRALDSIAQRQLAEGIGLQSYASFRRGPRGPRVTVYFPIQLYAPGTVAPANLETVPRSVADLLAQDAATVLQVARHPVLSRLRRSPPNPMRVGEFALALETLLITFLQEVREREQRATSPYAREAFARTVRGDEAALDWLRTLKGRTSRSRLLRWASATDRLCTDLSALLATPDERSAFGALLVGQRQLRALLQFLSGQTDRLSGARALSDANSTAWLDETHLEVLATNLPSDWVEPVIEGGRSTQKVFWHFGDDLYEALFETPTATSRLGVLA